jgi:hypothetical protein
MKLSAAMSDFGGQSYCRFGLKFWRPQGSLIRALGVSMDASLHGGSNNTIGGRVQPRRPELLPSYCQHCLFAVVVDTGEQFFGGIVDTGDKISPWCR